jgi:phenylalanyl-tRNA synthetase beta chain
MIVSHEWLKQFVPHSLSAAEVGELLSRHCVTLDAIEQGGAELAPIVVARVVEAGRHPNAERLWVTKVDDGSGALLDVVCGAPNVEVGTTYPFARTGTVLPGGVLIERRRIRGEVSNGMLCSARELNLGEEHDGILALDTDAAPGTPLLEVIAAADARLHLDVLPNRPDLLSHYGIARELRAITGVPVYPVPVTDLGPFTLEYEGQEGEREAKGQLASARVDSVTDCPRYEAVVITGLRVAPSPPWLRKRIESIGLRSISNVVDATNYILHGYGQPVHAFDLAKLAGSAIVVRETRAGESLVTLDGVTRSIEAGTTVICDAERPVALAGIMGGHDSEVTDSTTSVLLEVAAFDPKFVRRVRRAVGLSTDASYRFERGIDATALADVARIAGALIVAVAGGKIAEVLSVGAAPAPRPPVSLRISRVATLLGVPVPADEITRTLESLGCEVVSAGADVLHVTAPGWRHDLGLEVDLIEEVARIRGFDALPDELRPFRPGSVADDPLHLASRRVRDALVAHGFAEARPMPFTARGDGDSPRVRNPLAEDEPFLRASLLDTLVGRVEYNLSRMQGNVRLFEVGNAFLPSSDRLPLEEIRAAAVMMGHRRPPHFTEPNPPAFDQWDAKALAEAVASNAFPGAGVELRAGDGALLWEIVIDGHVKGRVERLQVDAPEWASATFGVELTLGALSSRDVAAEGEHRQGGEDSAPAGVVAAAPPVRYRPLPTTPAADFDLAMVVPDVISAETVEAALRRGAGELLERVELFDEYRGAGVQEGSRSLAWRLTLRHPERTLRDKEIEGRRARLIELLDKELGIRPRAT